MPAGRGQWTRYRGRRSLIAPRLARASFSAWLWGPFLRPGLRIEVRRAQGRSRLAPGHRRRRRGLDGREHGATLDQTGIYGTSCRGHGSFRGLPCCRSAATWHRGGWHRYVRNAINFVRSRPRPDAAANVAFRAAEVSRPGRVACDQNIFLGERLPWLHLIDA